MCRSPVVSVWRSWRRNSVVGRSATTALAGVRSIPPVVGAEGPSLAGRAVALGDVLQPPPHLGEWAGAPIGPRQRHLRSRQRLRNAIGPGGLVGSPWVPL